ncbi:LOW QUALITY PROTEIN: Terpene_synth domain-containing protein/Terpene_synth_C domain-containing protein, partial [Cephalotus follicularis]
QMHASFPICSTFVGVVTHKCYGNSIASFRNYSPVIRPIQCMTSTESIEQTIVRRSGNYHPSIWNDGYVQSLKSPYKGEAHNTRANKLKEEVRIMLDEVVDPLQQLELIDTLQRIGLAYHFKDQVKKILKSIYNDSQSHTDTRRKNLYATSLEFRLLRQHGYNVPQDVFNSFKDDNGSFKASLGDDIMGMLYLYEASYLAVELENTMEDARSFTRKHLEEYVKQNNNTYLSTLVSHALELPLHWRMLRFEARWFIDMYERKNDMNPTLLELAKVDFNMVQATHQEDLRYVSKWWRDTGLGEKLSFARDRLMENFFWTVGVIFEPQFGYCRRMTKVNALITTIDDVYDVYGTLDELELFTDAVERWDMNAIEQLPDYMKICFLALYNSVNEMGFDALKGEGTYIVPYLKKSWADLCKSFLLEAKWYYNKYTPTLQEYIDNAWISVSAPTILVHAFFFGTNPITKEGLQCLEKYPNIVQMSSIIFRLADDLGTSSIELERGDVLKSVQCYMHETGASEEDAGKHIQHLISKTWEKMNAECTSNSLFSDTFVGIAMNLGRMAQFMYQYGDGHGNDALEITKPFVVSLIVEPIKFAHGD